MRCSCDPQRSMLELRAKPTRRSVAGDVSYATLTSCVVILDKVDSTGRLPVLRLPPQRCLLGVAQTGSSQVANFFFFFFKSIMVRLRYRTICSTLSIVAILLRLSSHLTFAMKKAIPLNPIESALRCARV